jgi:hypothetical protein
MGRRKLRLPFAADSGLRATGRPTPSPRTFRYPHGNRIIPISLVRIERAQGTDDFGTICISHIIDLEFVTSIEPYDAARDRNASEI